MKARLFLLVLLLLPMLASAQDAVRRRDGQWTALSDGGCIGGSTCRQRSLRVPLDDDRTVVAVRFHAHDEVGQKADGKLRVKVDGITVRDYIDIPRRGETFTLDVEELSGRNLVFEAASNDEVEISDIAVLYARRGRRDDDDDDGRGGRGRGSDGWKAYPRAKGCIGGSQCSQNGTRITIALDSAPILGIRFYAHDSIGTRADGRVEVRIDDTLVAGYVDIQRNGKLHEFDVDGEHGLRLVIATTTNDEVEIKDVEVLYGRRGGRR